MTKEQYVEFLHKAEGMLGLLANSQPARQSPEPDRLFMRGVIDRMRTVLEAPWSRPTEAQRAKAKRLLDQLDRVEEYHFLKP